MGLDGKGILVVLAGGISICQWWAYGVFKVAFSLSQLRACVGGELGSGLSCLALFGHGHTQSGDSALASGALEAP